MKLSAKAFAVACAALWGGGVLFVGVLNAIFAPYGADFLHLIGSVYPGAGPGPTGVIVATIWSILDGATAGFLLAWLYNISSRSPDSLH